MNENKLTFIDENGNEVLCEILFTFHSDEFGKDYVLFYPEGEEDEQGRINVMAACYTENENGEGELFEITDDKEWELIEEMLEAFENEECDCDCEECDNEECEDHCCCHEE
jgi:uncharacterized protein YrzB (UPF0473 family)